MITKRYAMTAVILTVALVLAAGPALAAEKLSATPAQTKAMDAAHVEKARKMINDGLGYLLSKQDEKGGWALQGGAHNPALTAMVLKCLLGHPDFDTKSPAVKKGFDVLLSYQQKDGGIYEPKEGYQNYSTAVAVMALAAAGDPRYKEALDKAVEYLKDQQIVAGSESADGAKITEDHPFFGGVSYGKHGRPDLSNVGFSAEALHEAGLSQDDPYWENVVVFLTRTQNRSESNPRPWAKDGPNDGGFVYAPAIKADLSQGESKAGEGPGGRGLRSYGSMTYTGFKSMLYAGVDRKDPRVVGAFDWIRTHWRLETNPNMPAVRSKEGLFYYYMVFAKALRAWGEDTITDRKGEKHNWRHELVDTLAEKMQKGGYWENDSPRWFERLPELSTCYSVMALQEVLRK